MIILFCSHGIYPALSPGDPQGSEEALALLIMKIVGELHSVEGR
jgi:hypothetical protein